MSLSAIQSECSMNYQGLSFVQFPYRTNSNKIPDRSLKIVMEYLSFQLCLSVFIGKFQPLFCNFKNL